MPNRGMAQRGGFRGNMNNRGGGMSRGGHANRGHMNRGGGQGGPNQRGNFQQVG